MLGKVFMGITKLSKITNGSKFILQDNTDLTARTYLKLAKTLDSSIDPKLVPVARMNDGMVLHFRADIKVQKISDEV